MSIKKMLVILGALIVAATVFTACAGPAGPEGPAGPAGPEGPPGPAAVVETALQPETCGICHPDAGEKHQESYDELYQDGVIKVTDLAYRFTEPGTTVVTFKMTKNGAPFNGASVQNLNIYFVGYTGTAFEGAGRLSLKGKLSYDPASGVTTSTLEEKEPGADGYIDYTNVSGVDGILVVYGYNEQVGSLPARIRQVKYPYAAFLETGGGVDYVSAANNDGCEKCHTDPYLKHGNIYSRVNDDPATDFLTCKVCHLDNGEGGHLEWQLLVDDPVKAVEWLDSDEDLSIFTPEQLELYAYRTTLMNDVHMSHAMEFPYPQRQTGCGLVRCELQDRDL